MLERITSSGSAEIGIIEIRESAPALFAHATSVVLEDGSQALAATESQNVIVSPVVLVLYGTGFRGVTADLVALTVQGSSFSASSLREVPGFPGLQEIVVPVPKFVAPGYPGVALDWGTMLVGSGLTNGTSTHLRGL